MHWWVSPPFFLENYMIRTKLGCYEEKKFLHWGTYLIQIDDPDVKQVEINEFKVSNTFPKFPSKLSFAILDLFNYYCNELDQLEVGVLLLTNGTDWKCVVPKQIVSAASVSSVTSDNCDLITGEIYKQFPPHGWKHAGSWHSHNFMSAFFSGTDDESDRYVQGLHVVTGKLQDQVGVTLSSITIRGKRYLVNLIDVIDLEGYVYQKDQPRYHKIVSNYINIYAPVVSSSLFNSSSYQVLMDDIIPCTDYDSNLLAEEYYDELIKLLEKIEDLLDQFKLLDQDYYIEALNIVNDICDIKQRKKSLKIN